MCTVSVWVLSTRICPRQVRAAEAAERVAQHKREEAQRRKQQEAASRAKAEYIRKQLVRVDPHLPSV